MELPKRAKGDEFLPEGSYTRISERLRANPANADVTCLVLYAFDARTRLLPYIYFDKKMAPAGPRSVGAALFEAGFTKTRVVFQQWNPNFRPSQARIDGRPPDVLLVSTMQIHSEQAYRFILDAHSLGADRPLILAGGPKVFYEPEHLFTLGEEGALGADCCVTGEEYILLDLLETVTSLRAGGESMLKAFQRARSEGALNKVPGLVYEDPAPPAGVPRRLLNTGVQRLVRNMDELPMPAVGFRLIEPPGRGVGLGRAPLADNKVIRHSWLASLVTTRGCKFACTYCPIPAYNQRTWRQKSPERMVREVGELNEFFGFRYYFGTDDNFFNNRSTIEQFFETFAKGEYKGKPIRQNFRFSTEATEFDVYRNRDLLPLAKKAGLLAVWFGIEDMTAELINKGQTPEKTKELFGYMTELGLLPMAMIMHHDDQPLMSRGSLKGLINQAKFLFDSGAISFQCTSLSPATGTKVFDETLEGGTVIKTMDGKRIPEAYYDGNHVFATRLPNPWTRQLNLLAAYAYFYNPFHLIRRAVTHNKNQLRGVGYQLFGNMALPKTAWEMLKWSWKLATGKKDYWREVPAYPLPMHWVNEPGGKRPTSKPPAVLTLRPELGASLSGAAAAGM